jgi:hypothetical protein
MPTPPPPLGPFQFTLGRIFWTMFVCAVTAAIVRALDWPTEVEIPLLGLLLAYAAYAVFRLPSVLSDLRGRSAKWQRIHQQRAEMQRLIDERRNLPAASERPAANSRPDQSG